ncbi:MAG: thioredoxin-related protein [Flavobacteriaceae bacterium]|jgi:thioredoxin-related protein
MNMMRYTTLIATLLIGISTATAQENVVDAKDEIHWLSFSEAYELNKITPKKWVIDISTSWCGWCKKMDKDTFMDSLIVDFVADNYYAVALDGEYREVITLGEQSFKYVAEGRRGYHELPAALMGGKMSYPTIVFLDDQMNNLSPLPGYKGPKDFMTLLEYFSIYHPEDNPITWEVFKESYESPYGEVN